MTGIIWISGNFLAKYVSATIVSKPYLGGNNLPDLDLVPSTKNSKKLSSTNRDYTYSYNIAL